MKQHENISAEQKIDSKKALQAFKQLREIIHQYYPNGLTDEEINEIVQEERDKKYQKYIEAQRKH